MGSGKTTVGKLLGKKLNLKTIEIDEHVLKASKRKSINEIFEKDGELRFRELEIATAKKIGKKDNVVISPGGGVVMNKIILDYLREGGVVVYLETSFHEVEKRLASAHDRPLFKNPLAARKLYEYRGPLYDFLSEYMVITNGKTPEKVADEIIEKIKIPVTRKSPQPVPHIRARK